MNEEYMPIPSAVAQRISDEFKKSQVVICTFDPVHALLHFTTYGVSPEDKIQAAEMGDTISAIISDTSKKVEFEDFRHLDAATSKAKIDALRKALTVYYLFMKVLTDSDQGLDKETSINIKAEGYTVGTYTLAEMEALAKSAMKVSFTPEKP